MPKLVISGTAHELIENLITIGRGSDNMIVVNDPSVSTHHAQLQRASETYRLKDLGSTNGTHVNGIPVVETALRFDDRIRFGAAEARYEPDISGSQPLPQPEEITVKSAELSGLPADFTNASRFTSHCNLYRPSRCGGDISWQHDRGARDARTQLLAVPKAFGWPSKCNRERFRDR
jgi:FHA domain